ncbi:DUF3265 domain-containing protein [Vibrio alginolyticus]|nr:DUF3265 domain-containing protein [Vibrio alginolyticus]
MIRHAWHFYYALVLVIKVVCGSIVLCASHLNWALCVQLTLLVMNVYLLISRVLCSSSLFLESLMFFYPTITHS